MSIIVSALRANAEKRPTGIAIRSIEGDTTNAELLREAERIASELRARDARVVALMLDNHPAWAAIDVAAMIAEVTLVPIPLFFSDPQRKHAIADAKVDTVLTNQPHKFDILVDEGTPPYTQGEAIDVLGRNLSWMTPPNVDRAAGAKAMEGVAKITYTSGTTGEPKGVMLSREAMELVSSVCRDKLALTPEDRPLALVPLSVLMENLLGMHTSLLSGAPYTLIPMPALGFRGSAQIDPGATLDVLRTYEATQVICTPQVLQHLVRELARGAAPLPKLRFVGLGGAPASKPLLEASMKVGLPLYQGWGLSEASSVLTINLPGANKPGSVGKLLPYAKVKRADDGELLAGGPTVLMGYAGMPRRPIEEWLPTGDVGEFDEEGYLYITGRKKNVIINSYGRNLSPEWVEGELTSRPEIPQAVVYGEARPHLVAILVAPPSVDQAALKNAVAEVNWNLPDYAQIKDWVRATEAFSIMNGQLTGTGKPRHEVIYAAYKDQLERLYE